MAEGFGAREDGVVRAFERQVEAGARRFGEDEADVKGGKISVTSPIARAMMGKSEGDEIVVKAPSGDIGYEIEKVDYL